MVCLYRRGYLSTFHKIGKVDFRIFAVKLEKNERTVFLMNTQKCKEFIKKDLQSAVARCNDLINEIEETELIFVHNQLDRIMRDLENAKKRLKDCEDY